MVLSTRRLFVAVLFLALFAMAARGISDPDFWWHLRTGQYIFDTGSIPHSDIFSLTNAGKEWTAHEWLSEVIIYALFRAGGYTLLILSFAALIAASFAFAYLACPGKPYIAAFVVLFAAISTAPTWGVRPQIFSLLLTSLSLLLLEKYRERADLRYLVPLVPLTVLWVNLHSGYALGLVIIAVYLIGAWVDTRTGGIIWIQRTRLVQLGGVLLICALAVLINPNGARMYTYPLETLTSPTMQRYIQEWFSPDFHQVEFQPFALLLLSLVAGGILSRARIPISSLVLVLLFGYASLRSARLIPMFALAAAPVLAMQVTDLVGRFTRIEVRERMAAPRVLVAINLLILLLVAGAVLARALAVADGQPRLEAEKYPAAAVDFLVSRGTTGGLINTYGWGGYLIWRLYPTTRVYIDGRADVYGDQFIENYLSIYRASPGWDATLAEQGVNLALIEPDSLLAAAMLKSADWTRIYSDQQSVIFARK